MDDIFRIFKRIEEGKKTPREELEKLGIRERISHREWLEKLEVEGMDVHTYMKLNPPESEVFVVPRSEYGELLIEEKKKELERKRRLREIEEPRANKFRKPRKKIPIEKVKELRERGFSYRQIAVILLEEDGIYVSPQTIWRRLRELKC